MVRASLVVLVAGLCSSLTLAQDCTPSPLWIFSDPEDLRHIYTDIEEPLVLVSDGVPAQVLTIPEFATRYLALFEIVEEVPIIWCLQQDTQFQEIQYSLRVESANTDVVEDPTVTVPAQGTISTVPFRFRLLFRCFATDSTTMPTIGITFSVNTTSSTGEEFCPIKLFFGKTCFIEGSRRDEGEQPTDLERLGITDGYLNNYSISLKTNAPPLVPLPDSGAESLLTIVLKGVLIPLCIILLVSSIIAVLVWVTWYQRSKSNIAEFHPEAVSHAYKELYASVYSRGEHEKEFPYHKLRILRELGEGAFGVVSQGQAEGIVEGEVSTDVAVKQLRDGSSEADEFFREVDFMSSLEHPNVVRLLGVCSLEEPYSMIFEYMDLGDLCSFLREAIGLGKDMDDHEEDEDTPTEPLLTHQELLTISHQVATGMAYISSMHLVHRDLAARNCLVATGLVVKIADFGMSRNIDTTDYYRVKGSAMLPVRWMPPESVLYGKFTVESDIWAYGILLWEVFTFGQKPYFGLDNEEVISRIKAGKPPDPPAGCPAHILMLQCWNRNPKKRPQFEQCAKQIEQLISSMD